MLTSKSIPAATVALIDPESGTSSGGSSTDVNVAVGDVILFQFNFSAVPDLATSGLQGYLTEFIPDNTQVVGVRLIDANGLTIVPNLPGAAPDTCAGPCNGSTFANLPCSAGTNCSSNQVSFTNGTIAQVYADTGIFYATDTRLNRNPFNAFITLQNGTDMTAAGKEPTYAGSISGLIGLANNDHYYSHDFWDFVQLIGYGWKNSATSKNSGKSNTPYKYGSPVAGPNTFYTYEATNTTTSTSTTTAHFNDVVGPWQRIVYPGSKIGSGSASLSSSTSTLTRVSLDTSAGFDLRPNNSIPDNASALRYALGETRVGEVRAAEVALRVLGTPLDTAFGTSGGDVDCAEVMGGDAAGTNNSNDNPWPLYLPSANCVFLNLLLDLKVNKPVADGSDILVYTLRVKNLSKQTQTNVRVLARYAGNDFNLVSADNGATEGTCPANTGGSGDTCLDFGTIATFEPSDEVTYTFRLDVGGQGSGANVVFANYSSQTLALPGFTTQALTIVKPVAVLGGRLGPTTSTPATAGGTKTFSGTLRNDGNQSASMDSITFNLPTGWTLSGAPTVSEGSLSCATTPNCTSTNTPKFTFSGVSVDPLPQCNDGLDNDSDGNIDSDDAQCASALDNNETVTTSTVTQPDITYGFTVNVPSMGTGSANGQYAIEVQTYHGQQGYGGATETYFSKISSFPPACSNGLDDERDGNFDYPEDPGCSSALDDDETATLSYVPEFGVVTVGQSRSARPTLTCPIGDNATSISGTLASNAPANATVKLYFNGIQRASTTTATTAFTATGFASLPACSDGINNDGDANTDYPADTGCASKFDNDEGAATTVNAQFGELYGGLEVRATVTLSGDLESPLSEPCFVSVVPDCSDGKDNDGDGLIDFPGDPGCSSGEDGSETDPQCSDGIDNDSDGDVDFPDDYECSSPDDTSEGGVPACSDGLDNDGDGDVDVDDADCTNSMDRTEVSFDACNDGVDNDGDGDADFPEDVGCHSANDDSEVDLTFADVRSRVMLLFDTSGSMNWNSCDDVFTGGDGSNACPGNAIGCGTCDADNCTNGIADDSRLYKAKAGVANVVAGFGEVEYGLMRFHQRPIDFSCPTANASANSGGWQGAGGAPCSGGFAGGDLLVAFDSENQYDLLEYVDGDTNYSAAPPAGLDIELRGSGTTPLAGMLGSALGELNDVRASDPAGSCRPYVVIMLTDGEETCGGDPVDAAGDLQNAGYDVHVIGFATDDPNTVDQLNNIADAGGTTDAIFVDDSAALATAMSDIVAANILTEVCDGLDNDCDLAVDEGFSLYCNLPGHTAQDLCANPGEVLCDGLDNNCNGQVDEGLTNACGTCGAVPTEICDGLDNNCNGVIDENNVCAGCVKQPEICDGLDNDCDTIVDEALQRLCGTDTGECTAGVETCDDGDWINCSAVGGSAETCNNLDDDCDGTVDGISRSCGTDEGACQLGSELCLAGAWGECVGDIEPVTEVCNGVDDNCDGAVDEGNPGGGATCGSAIGECSTGTFQCVSGAIDCVGDVTPVAEACNGNDDDCDGQTDEGVPTAGACGSAIGECKPGVLTCNRTTGTFQCVGAVGATTELCNGKDDNCNNTVDDAVQDSWLGNVCGTSQGECSTGTYVCTAGARDCANDVGPAAEVCNNLDDDCDGQIDDAPNDPDLGAACPGLITAVCHPGFYACVDGSLECVGAETGGQEQCDGEDNDCDGQTDEALTRACGSSVGRCSPGTEQCVAGDWANCDALGPYTEVCNNLDDDCDGDIDNDVTDATAGTACTGVITADCHPGYYTCVDGSLTCIGGLDGGPEQCDGEDNDCDGQTDEALTRACGSNTGECAPGTEQCVAGAWANCSAQGPFLEVCNNLDDDCDGNIDNDVTDATAGTACAGVINADCHPGYYTCVDGSLTCIGGLDGGPEQCDGIDNDCDAQTDEALTRACGSNVGRCSPGTEQCVAGDWANCDAVGPFAEICNNLDDDCDGDIDNGVTDTQAGTACPGVITVDCHPGYYTCVDGNFACIGGLDGGPEQCDGVDNDCDGNVDEALVGPCSTDVGECTVGEATCDNGSWVNCTGTLPSAELCDGLDNDCDGEEDNGVTDVQNGTVCPGVIQGDCHPGYYTCVGGMYVCLGAETGGPESCDGIDNNCNGMIDENLVGPCSTDVGECEIGEATCDNGQWVNCTGVLPDDELCDSKDNDCDGEIDNDVTEAQSGTACGGSVGDCEPGAWTCIDGTFVCLGEQLGGPEVCDNADNDCDGMIDDGLSRSCGTDVGECITGTETCSAGVWAGCDAVVPMTEFCDGLDNDCNQLVDDDVQDVWLGSSCGSDEGDCSPGIWLCVDGMQTCFGADLGGPEECDNADNDCDGMIDDGLSRSCGSDVGQCELGNEACVAGAWVGCDAVGPMAEECNTLDDNCNGLTDENNPEGGGTCGATDVGECAFGVLQCQSGNLVCVGEKIGSDELCDGLDNDCDGTVDEGNPESGQPCGGGGNCQSGLTDCQAGVLVCAGSDTSAPEICNGIDDDCDGVIDDGFPVGGPCGTDEGACSPGIYNCKDDLLNCEGAEGPFEEICNGIDDDCDGRTDDVGMLGACGKDEGMCKKGMLQCIDGKEVCVDNVPPSPEVCDCKDNNCNGEVDEESKDSTLCPAGASCIDCQCAIPCQDSEFGACPTGKFPQENEDGCFCVEAQCDDAACAGKTIDDGSGNVLCAPDSADVGACVCRQNDCTFGCDGMNCVDGTVCDPVTITCVENNCRGLGCAPGEVCDVTSLECTVDKCAEVDCGSDVCRDGVCEKSCAEIVCPRGESCVLGKCEEDPCFEVSCITGEICDPTAGKCIANACESRGLCGKGEICNPLDGECEADPCTKIVCPEGQSCSAGDCRLPAGTRVDGGVIGEGGKLPPPPDPNVDPETRVTATGGGGCACTVAPRGTPPPLSGLLVGMVIVMLFVVRRRRSS